MFCQGCGARSEGSERFCRKCGANLLAVARGGEGVDQNVHTRAGMAAVADSEKLTSEKDPDVLTGNGVASFFIGDGFFFSGILLSVLESSVQSWLWLLLLIPAFSFFGKGFSDVWQGRQIRRRLKQNELDAAPVPESVEVLPRPSVTERTTRQLK